LRDSAALSAAAGGEGEGPQVATASSGGSRIPAYHKGWPQGMSEELARTAMSHPTEEEADRQGQWAYGFGFNFDSNPYIATSDAWQWWANGWKASEMNDEG
jgi:hypothetical protein